MVDLTKKGKPAKPSRAPIATPPGFSPAAPPMIHRPTPLDAMIPDHAPGRPGQTIGDGPFKETSHG